MMKKIIDEINMQKEIFKLKKEYKNGNINYYEYINAIDSIYRNYDHT